MFSRLLVLVLAFGMEVNPAHAKQERYLGAGGGLFPLVAKGVALETTPDAHTGWRAAFGAIAGVSVAAAAVFGALGYHSASRLGDPTLPPAQIPGVRNAQNGYLAGLGASAGAAIASLIAWWLLRPDRGRSRSILQPTGSGFAAGLRF